jgi:hypothetical protein
MVLAVQLNPVRIEGGNRAANRAQGSRPFVIFGRRKRPRGSGLPLPNPHPTTVVLPQRNSVTGASALENPIQIKYIKYMPICRD